jgi:hypothetical protein
MADFIDLIHPVGILDSNNNGLSDHLEFEQGLSVYSDGPGAVMHGYTSHLHLVPESRAADTDGDGVSDATEVHLGTDPLDPSSQPVVGLGPYDRADSDGDGFTDVAELRTGTDPMDPQSQPKLVQARHYPAGSDENLPGTLDVSINSWLGGVG